ncbi:hypothetical protein CVT26_008760, partial [Gymnopilus dilepis]
MGRLDIVSSAYLPFAEALLLHLRIKRQLRQLSVVLNTARKSLPSRLLSPASFDDVGLTLSPNWDPLTCRGFFAALTLTWSRGCSSFTFAMPRKGLDVVPSCLPPFLYRRSRCSPPQASTMSAVNRSPSLRSRCSPPQASTMSAVNRSPSLPDRPRPRPRTSYTPTMKALALTDDLGWHPLMTPMRREAARRIDEAAARAAASPSLPASPVPRELSVEFVTARQKMAAHNARLAAHNAKVAAKLDANKREEKIARKAAEYTESLRKAASAKRRAYAAHASAAVDELRRQGLKVGPPRPRLHAALPAVPLPVVAVAERQLSPKSEPQEDPNLTDDDDGQIVPYDVPRKDEDKDDPAPPGGDDVLDAGYISSHSDDIPSSQHPPFTQRERSPSQSPRSLAPPPDLVDDFFTSGPPVDDDGRSFLRSLRVPKFQRLYTPPWESDDSGSDFEASREAEKKARKGGYDTEEEDDLEDRELEDEVVDEGDELPPMSMDVDPAPSSGSLPALQATTFGGLQGLFKVTKNRPQ